MLNDSYRLCDKGYVGIGSVCVSFAVAASSFLGDNSVQAKRRKHSGKLGTRSGGAASGGCKWQSMEGGCKLVRQGQDKFQDREAETIRGKNVQKQSILRRSNIKAKTE